MFQVKKELCIACKQCIKDCPVSVISLEDEKAFIHNEGCIKCGHCVAICPVAAVSTDDYDMGEVLPYNKDTFSIDAEILLNFIKFRRSVRRFKKNKVEKDNILKIIEAGRFTQTSTNSQDVSYTVVTDKLDELKDMAYESLRVKGEAILTNLTPKTQYLERYANFWLSMYEAHKKAPEKYDNLFYHAPLVIIVTSPNPLNAGLASSNMELMTDALGLGTFFSGFAVTAIKDNQEILNFLGIKDGTQIVTCFVIGYPDVKYQRTAPRKEADIRWI